MGSSLTYVGCSFHIQLYHIVAQIVRGRWLEVNNSSTALDVDCLEILQSIENQSLRLTGSDHLLCLALTVYK